MQPNKTAIRVKVTTDGPAKVTVDLRDLRTTGRPRKPLKFGNGNGKLDQAVFTFSLPAGWACPFARLCLAKTDRKRGTLKDGPGTEHRCFAASDETRGPSVREARWHNFEQLRGLTRPEMTRLILDSLSPFAGLVRIHVSGDFFSQDYFDAWLEVTRERPDTRFYFYTKSLLYWVARLDYVGDGHREGRVPNFVPTASWGGTHDHLIERHGLRWSKVVVARSLDEAERIGRDQGLEFDHDDSHAMRHGPDFLLLIHGSQPKGSEAGKAVYALRQQGEFGYGQRANARRAQVRLAR